MTTTTSHVGSSLSSASICTHNNPTTHPLACNCETGWVFIIIFFESRTPTTTTSHVGSSLSSASIVDPQRVITTRWGLSLPLHLQRQPQRPPTSHYDSLGALSPPPPATPASSTPFSRRRPCL